ncbi:MAG: hypothetical protein EBS53_10460 [Bacteroidetes bacterium]|nr:hypothetical protein [Bacteroidota bacterium]
MAEGGWSVSRYRHREMCAYVQACPGAILRHGALKGERTGEIFSYAMLIGRVFHEKKILMYREDAGERSRTTNMHMGAIRGSQSMLEERGWTLLPVTASQMSAHDPADAARQLWGNKLREKDLDNILHYRKLLESRLYLSRVRHFAAVRDGMLREYVKASRVKRQAMQAILEMQVEQGGTFP